MANITTMIRGPTTSQPDNGLSCSASVSFLWLEKVMQLLLSMTSSTSLVGEAWMEKT